MTSLLRLLYNIDIESEVSQMTHEDKEKEKQERLEAYAGYLLASTETLVHAIVKKKDLSAMLQLVVGYREVVSSLQNFNIYPN